MLSFDLSDVWPINSLYFVEDGFDGCEYLFECPLCSLHLGSCFSLIPSTHYHMQAWVSCWFISQSCAHEGKVYHKQFCPLPIICRKMWVLIGLLYEFVLHCLYLTSCHELQFVVRIIFLVFGWSFHFVTDSIEYLLTVSINFHVCRLSFFHLICLTCLPLL